MINRDDVTRALVRCAYCGAGYIAHQWPDGELQLIGTQTCQCGSTEFEVVDDRQNNDSSGEPRAR